MLLEFTVGNFRSFKERKTLSLEASSITEFEDNIFKKAGYKILKSAVIYGANSSGKSNLLEAFKKMREIVSTSSSKTSTDKIDVIPFLLSTETEYAASFFEVVFLSKDVRYRYGFEATETEVVSEWLYKKQKSKEKELFTRIGENIDISEKFDEGFGLEQKTRKNALFLATVDQFNGSISHTVMEFFNQHVMLSGVNHEANRTLTMRYLRMSNLKDRMRKFIDDFKFGFESISIDEDKDATDNSVKTKHKKYNGDGEEVGFVDFLMSQQESSGTNKMFDMAGYIWVGLMIGLVVVIDELDAKLHPLITQAVVDLFNSKEKNPNNAQLIFVTHDTNLLNCGRFRRDQIYFSEKDQFDATDLYSLVEYKDENDISVRKDRKFEKDYIQGRYGAIPFVGDFSDLL